MSELPSVDVATVNEAGAWVQVNIAGVWHDDPAFCASMQRAYRGAGREPEATMQLMRGGLPAGVAVGGNMLSQPIENRPVGKPIWLRAKRPSG